jgi:hypothetical protein
MHQLVQKPFMGPFAGPFAVALILVLAASLVLLVLQSVPY